MARVAGLNWEELDIVQPKGSLDQRIARNAHDLDRDQSRLRSGREISWQSPPAAGAQQVFGAQRAIVRRLKNVAEVEGKETWPDLTPFAFSRT